MSLHLKRQKRICNGNLHAPEIGYSTKEESGEGAFGIPEFMPPVRRRTFKVMIEEKFKERDANL